MATKSALTTVSILLDLNSACAQSGPEDGFTEEEFNEALGKSGKDAPPGPDTVHTRISRA